MDDRVAESALIDDFHAHPNIHIAEYALLILGIFFGVIEEDAMEELVGVELGEGVELDWIFAVATESGPFFIFLPTEHSIHHVFSSCYVRQLFVGIASVSLGE